MTLAKTRNDYITHHAYWEHITNGNQKTFDGYYSRDRLYSGSSVGNKVEGWRRLIASMRQAGSPYTSDRYFLDKRSHPIRVSYVGYDRGLPTPPWSNQKKNTYSGGLIYLSDIAVINHLTTNSAKARNNALKKLYRLIREQEEAFNYAPFVAELKEALGMIRRPADALQQAVTNYLRHMRKNHARMVRGVPLAKRPAVIRKVLAGSWAEFSFGWAPTVGDVESAAEALARFVDETNNGGRLSYKRIQASGRDIVQIDHGLGKVWDNTVREVSMTRQTTTSETYRYVVGWLQDIEVALGGSPRHFARVFGVDNFRNLALGAYEVIPFSWLVDYFINVGEILEAWATPTHQIQWIVETRLQATKVTRYYQHTGRQHVPWSTKYDFQIHPGQSAHCRYTMTRSLPTSLPLMTLQQKSPWGSAGKMANMAAVWTQMTHDIITPHLRRG
nr:MAG: maturation protein [Hangzhou atkins-like virus 2]